MKVFTVLLGTLPLVAPLEAAPPATRVTLATLADDAQVIAYGHTRAITNAAQPFSFQPLALLKGPTSTGGGDILLCNPVFDFEWPAFTVSDNYVLFLRKSRDCFLPASGPSVIRASEGRAATSSIDGEPSEQSIKAFLKKIRALVPDHS